MNTLLLSFTLVFTVAILSPIRLHADDETFNQNAHLPNTNQNELQVQVDMGQMDDAMGLWGQVSGAHAAASALILEGRNEDAIKAAKTGLEKMKALKQYRYPANSTQEDHLSEKDMRQAEEVAVALKEFVEGKSRLYEPGKERNFYYSAEKHAMVIVSPVQSGSGSHLTTGSGDPVVTETEMTLPDLMKPKPKK